MILEEVLSEYSGKLQVHRLFPWTKPYISTGFLTQSGGLVHDVWKPILKIFKTHNSKYHKYLILGLAGGTLAKLIHQVNPQAKITGVEIDPQMIYLGKRYLYLDQIPGLTIIQADAQKFVQSYHNTFDAVFVDMYYNDQMPNFVYSPKFLTRLFKIGKTIIINHLFYDDIKRNQAKLLIKSLESSANQIRLQRVLTNVLIIATPKSPRQS